MHTGGDFVFTDSEESESSEMSALLRNPDLDTDEELSIRELQEPSEAGGEGRSRVEQPQPTVVDDEEEEEKAEYNEEGMPPSVQPPRESSGQQGEIQVEPVATVPPTDFIDNPASQVKLFDQSLVQARDQVRTGKVAVPQPPSGKRPTVSSSAEVRGNGSVAGEKSNGQSILPYRPAIFLIIF